MISQPFSSEDLLAGGAYGACLLVVLIIAHRHLVEGKLILIAGIVKILAAYTFAVVVLTYYAGNNDTVGYHAVGAQIARQLRADAFGGLQIYPFWLLFGSNTNREFNLSGWIHLFGMNSYLASSLLFACLGFVGQVLLYKAFRRIYPQPQIRLWWRFGILFMPSVTYWSAGMLKDPAGLLGLGCAVYGLQRFLEQRTWRFALTAIIGFYLLFLFRLETILALSVALVPWLFSIMRLQTPATPVIRRLAQTRLVPIALLALLSFVTIFALAYETRFTLATLPTALAHQNSGYVGNQSTVRLTYSASWLGLVESVPGALVLVLFRPFPWEAHGIPALLASLENVAIFALLIRGVTSVRLSTLKRIVRAPLFATSLLFVILFGVALGASTPNLGTLSRLRMPMIPFLVCVLVVMELHAHRIASVADDPDLRLQRERDMSPAGPCLTGLPSGGGSAVRGSSGGIR